MKAEIEKTKAAIENDTHYERTRMLLGALDESVRTSQSLSQDTDLITRSLNLMLWAHFRQKDRPDGQPYINHPLCVALHIVNEFEIFQSDVLVAALLHDTVEDQPEKVVHWSGAKYRDADMEEQALQILGKNFGIKVASYVSKLTNPNFDAKIGRLAKSGKDRERMKVGLYLRHFEKLFDENEWAFTIKMADFSQNAMHINVLGESPKKDWLRRKYGPVIQMVIGRLKTLDDTSHPLFGVKKDLSEKLQSVYKQDYQAI